METNIFQDAYFGKPYKTRGEDTALYSHYDDNYNLHKLFTYSHIVWVDNEGFVDEEHIELNHPDDIVSEWTEEISEEELDELAFNSASPSLQNGIHSLKLYKDGFKAGFRARGCYCKGKD